MGLRGKFILLISFVATTLYTGYGIMQLGNQGGPCNAGIAIIVLTPVLLICTVLLAKTFSSMVASKKTNLTKPIIFSLVSLLVWTFWFYVFAVDDIKDSILYLGLFELLNMMILSFFVRQAMKRKSENKQVTQ